MTQCYGDQHINTDCINLKFYRRNQSEICWIQYVGYNVPTTPLFKQLGIIKLMDIYNIQLCKLMYSYTNGTVLTQFQILFTNNSLLHSHQTRHSREPHIIARKTSSAVRTFIYQYPKGWLALPDDVKNYKSVKSFSQRVNTYHCHITLLLCHLYSNI